MNEAQTTDDQAAAPKKNSAVAQLKESSLKAAGIAYLVGDVALSTARIMEGDPTGAAGGALWAVGSITCAKYGSPKAEQQFKLLDRRLGAYLQKQGVEIPKHPSTADLTKQGGVIEHIESFLYAYPSQILNTVYAVGGAMVGVGGMKHNHKSDMACGALITAGGLAGLLIPEKAPDPDHPPHSGLEKLWAWAQEKPLRVSGAFYHVNNIFTVLGAVEKKRSNPTGKSHLFRYLTAASFIFANTALAMSSKGHSGGDKNGDSVMAHTADTSARIIAAQAPELQEALVQQIAGYLASQPEIDKKPDEIAALLHAKLATIGRERSSPVASWQQQIALQPSAPAAPAL